MSRARQIADLGSPAASGLSNRNLIINGGMRIAQRGTSSTSSGYGTVDRTKPEFSGPSITQTQTALTSGGPYDDGHRYFLRCTNTSVSSGANDFFQINQEIEAQNVATSGWNFTSTSSYVTMSFWVRSSLAGTYYVLLKSHDGTAQGFTSAFTLVADTWKKIEVTVPGNSNITINTDNGHGLRCYVVPYFGTNYTTSGHTSDAWQALDNTNLSPDYAQSWINTANATFDLTGWMVEVGTSASPFEHEDIAITYEKCQRYYVKLLSNTNYDTYGPGIAYVTTQFYATLPIPTRMRSDPSIGSSGSFAAMSNGSHHATDGAPIYNRALVDTMSMEVYFDMTTNNLVAGHACQLRNNNDSDAYIEVISEL